MPPSGAVPFPRVFVLSRCFTERCRWLENPASKQQWQAMATMPNSRASAMVALTMAALPGSIAICRTKSCAIFTRSAGYRRK